MADAGEPFALLDALQTKTPNALRFFSALCLVMDVPARYNDRLCRFLEQTYARPFAMGPEESVEACVRVFQGVYDGCEHQAQRYEELRKTLVRYVEA